MRILFKLLLILAVLVSGTYATVPLWFPLVFASQLPPGWKLVDIDPAYPGLSNMRIKSLSIVAELPLANLTVSATDFLVAYRTRGMSVGSMDLEVSLAADTSEGEDRLALDDLVLPVIDLGGDLPELTVQELHLTLRHGLTAAVPDPVLLELRSFALAPIASTGWRFNAGIRPEGAADDIGRLVVESFSKTFSTGFQFPSDPTLPSWLTLTLNQDTLGAETSTRLEMSLDADRVEQEFLSALATLGFRGDAPRFKGRMNAQAEFSGQQLQAFNQMTVSAQGLQAEFENAAVSADLEMLATVEGPDMKVALLEPGEVRYQERAGNTDVLLEQFLPDFELTPQTGTTVTARFEKGVTFNLRPGDEPALRLTGDVDIGLKSDKRSIDLETRGLDLGLAGFKVQDRLRFQGEIEVDWKENAPLTARLPGKTLRAQSFSLSSKGVVRLVEQGLEYEQAGQLGLQYPDIELAGDELSPPMAMTAASIAAEFDLATRGGAIISNGRARIAKARVDQPPTTSDTVDVTWQDLDLDRMAGQFSARTTGFSTEIEGQQWRGFELDSDFSMDATAVLRGTATLVIRNGSELPFEFEGSTVTGRWEVAVPPTTIMWDRLENTLRAGQFPWPEGVRMTGGEVALQGQVTLAESLAARLQSRAFGLGAAILENTASDAGFELDITLADVLSVSGPVAIESAVLAGGVKVTGFAAQLELAGVDLLTLRNIEAEVFGGKLEASRLHFTPDGIEDTEIRLMHIDLSRLLTFLDIAGLQGTGTLGILLPVGSDKAGIHVKGGTFQSTGAGFLAYRQAGVAASNIGLQALQNFQYQSLSGTLEYQSAGAYQVGVRLEGKNPDLYGGHPIVFRLNISGVMPELFEALFMTGNFEESILKEIRTQ